MASLKKELNLKDLNHYAETWQTVINMLHGMEKTTDPSECQKEIDAGIARLKIIDAKEIKSKPYYNSQAMVHLLELKAENLVQLAEKSKTPEVQIMESL